MGWANWWRLAFLLVCKIDSLSTVGRQCMRCNGRASPPASSDANSQCNQTGRFLLQVSAGPDMYGHRQPVPETCKMDAIPNPVASHVG